jgi:hypothetical protein
MTSSIWRRVDHFVSTPVDDGVVILDLNKGVYYSFTETAAAIWGLFEEDRGQSEIEAALVKRFDVSAEVCAVKVADFIGELAAKDLIRQVN